MASSRSTSTDLVSGKFGARGSGKSHEVKDELARDRPARLLMIDPLDEYGGEAERVATLKDMVRRSSGAEFRLRYVPPDVGTDAERAVRFAMFCTLAWHRGRLTMVVEEAQLFTRASSAPPAWAQCTLRGRHRAIRIYALSQRPASIDKDFFSNATVLRTGRLNFADDVACMAGALRVPRDAVANLLGREWVSRDMLNGTLASAPPIGELVARSSPMATLPERPPPQKKLPRRRR